MARWQRLNSDGYPDPNGHNVDTLARPIASALEPWRDVEPEPPAAFPAGSLTHEEGIALGAQVREALAAAAPDAAEVCAACGRPLIGVAP